MYFLIDILGISKEMCNLKNEIRREERTSKIKGKIKVKEKRAWESFSKLPLARRLLAQALA